MADAGIKISKPGFDIKFTDLQNQIFNSEANSLKIWLTGQTNITVSAYNAAMGTGGIGSANIAHGLGYEPFYLVYFKLKDANKLWMQDSLDETQMGGPGFYFIRCGAVSNPTNLVVDVSLNGDVDLASWTAVAYYIIFIDKAYE